MQLFSHSERCQSFVNPNRLVFLIYILCSLNFALFANSDADILTSKISGDPVKELSSTEKGYFILEEIPGKYKVIKAVINGKQILMRPGRIELFLSSSDQHESSYLIFEDAQTNAYPVGINKISESEELITNSDMAEALGETSFKVSIFEKLVYKDLYTGIDLELTIGKNGLKSTIISTNKQVSRSSINMIFQSSSKVQSKGKSLMITNTLNQSPVELSSQNGNLKTLNSNNIQFSSDSKSLENLTFDIILK